MKIKFRILHNCKKGVYYAQFKSWGKWRYFNSRCEGVIFHNTEEEAVKYALAIQPEYVSLWFQLLWEVFVIYPSVYQYPTIKFYN